MEDGLGRVQSVLLLGGTSEIGQAIVRRLVVGRSGCRVVLAARSADACTPFVTELRDVGTIVDVVTFDASDTASHASVIERAAASGDLDVVVMAWGLLGHSGFEDADVTAAIDVSTVNYVGVVSAGLHAARVLSGQGHGALVYLSSVAGERVRRANFVYGSTKAGADAFMQGLADALVGTGVRVLVVRPGFVDTKMTAGIEPMPFATTAEAVAQATVAGLGRSGTTVWAPALLRPVFMVLRHLPRAVWRRLPR